MMIKPQQTAIRCAERLAAPGPAYPNRKAPRFALRSSRKQCNACCMTQLTVKAAADHVLGRHCFNT